MLLAAHLLTLAFVVDTALRIFPEQSFGQQQEWERLCFCFSKNYIISDLKIIYQTVYLNPIIEHIRNLGSDEMEWLAQMSLAS